MRRTASVPEDELGGGGLHLHGRRSRGVVGVETLKLLVVDVEELLVGLVLLLRRLRRALPRRREADELRERQHRVSDAITNKQIKPNNFARVSKFQDFSDKKFVVFTSMM